ncbi:MULTISPECIES: Ig-like domain-containing protein [Paenibacillus]|uniref:Ig-like domain-containing protein n=1 Tax=Paenibacillus TaxID=44249 RepID=UPI0022B93368|nr:Ig-like domain-containing protein [Paenibacillus caseinilyticus]
MNKIRSKWIGVVAASLAVTGAAGGGLPASGIASAETSAPVNVLAFPGAEGGGMYASGGRGDEVYEVTTLEDYGIGEAPLAGSLRDAVSQGDRTVVFRLSGTIHLKQPLKIKAKNLTIAGQTAPGDGIAVAGYGTDISGSENLILRYMRFRPGSAHIDAEPDAFGGRDVKNAIIDHISASWSVDETLSLYRNADTTLQWSIVSESMLLSGHVKGRHGYGGIWGGGNATFSNNLIASHVSRAPALGNGGNTVYPVGSTDLVNNVIYNWGFNSTYGGNDQDNNIINNYYKPGPSTYANVLKRIVSPGQDGKLSRFHISGNVMHGNAAVSADNTLGTEEVKSGTEFSDTAYPVAGHDSLGIKPAGQAYREVLNKAGATYPRRDAVDARIVNDVKEGTGRLINNEWEAGGFPELKSLPAPADTDHDGMPDTWERKQGLDAADAADGRRITGSGYSNLELYLHSLVDMNAAPANPEVSLQSPEGNSIHKAGSSIKLNVRLKDKRNIAKVEYYRNDVRIGESTGGSFDYTWKDVPDGTWYVSAKAIDRAGNATQTTSMPVHVNTMKQSGEWSSKDIGKVGIKGNAAVTSEGLTVKGAGRISGTADAFQFAYREIKGDAVLTARLDSLTKVDNNALSGLMIRDSLAPDAAAAVISSSVVKADEGTPFAVFFSTRTQKGEPIAAPGENDFPEDHGLPALKGTAVPYWMKIVRSGDTITGYASPDGVQWTEVGASRIPMGRTVYVGFAVDAAKNSSRIVNYNTAAFSHITLEGDTGRKKE